MLRRMANVYAVIMAGGAGTRFWPASRSRRPKQLLPLGGGEEPLLASTVRRLSPLVPADRVLVVTGEHLAEATIAALPGVSRDRILCEPAPRNTAPCIAWASATIERLDPDAVVMVLPSDHFIADEAEFREVLARAVASAESGRVTTVGIVPTRPETGYGYIEVGGDLAGGRNGAKEVARFVEKPDRARAEAFLAGGKHLWNAGMFFFRAREMSALVAKHLPELASGVAKIDAAARAGNEAATVKEVFPTLPSVSIDHGVMEKAKGLAVVPGDFGWNDVGSWQSAWELGAKDASDNALDPGAVAVDAKRNLVRVLGAAKGKKVVALVGVEDLVVVDTDDALLVIPRERAQDVRLVIEALKAAGKTDLL
jgi:mannose-1-phosphate guanylyltransferase